MDATMNNTIDTGHDHDHEEDDVSTGRQHELSFSPTFHYNFDIEHFRAFRDNTGCWRWRLGTASR
jgi:hypothetical protein